MDQNLKKRKRQNAVKPDCKYGSSCYQTNPEHRKKYKHPSAKKFKNNPKQNVDDFTVVHTETENSKLDIAEDITDVQTDVENIPLTPISSCKENVEDKLKLMPKDFFDLWDFCKTIEDLKPEEAFEDLGLHLVGPYDILSQKLTNNDVSNYYCHWRYYYDPPEFQTVIKQDGEDLYHIGYFRDDPKEIPSVLASNCAAVGPKLTLVGDNIFSAVNLAITKSMKGIKNKTTKEKFSNIQSDLQKLAKMKKYSLELQTSKTKARDKKVVCKSFHGFGIVVPYDKERDVGYRPLPDSNATLKSILKKIASTEDKKKSLKESEKLDEIISNVHFANDEGDPGMGLELGIDLFCFGEPILHPYISFVLCLAYDLVKRPEYKEIVKAHLKNRKKGIPKCNTIWTLEQGKYYNSIV